MSIIIKSNLIFFYSEGASEAGSLLIKNLHRCIKNNDDDGVLDLLKKCRSGKTKLDSKEAKQVLIIIVTTYLPKLKHGGYGRDKNLQIFIFGLTFGLREFLGGTLGGVTGLLGGVGGFLGGVTKGLKDGLNGGLNRFHLVGGLLEGVLQAVEQGLNGFVSNAAGGYIGGASSVIVPQNGL